MSESMSIDSCSELQNRMFILDGAMGTMLQQEGLGRGECPEMFNLTHPHILEDIHSAYIEAGCDIIQTNTFGANHFKLSEYGLGDKVEEINSRAVKIARKAAGTRALVALSAGPSGKLFKPSETLNLMSFLKLSPSNSGRRKRRSGSDFH